MPRYGTPQHGSRRRAWIANGVVALVAATSLVVFAARVAHGQREATPRAQQGRRVPSWEAENPIRPLTAPPLGMEFSLKQAKTTVVPARVRLGRWLFYDARLSADGKISCATCHRPEHAFSEPASVATGMHGRRGTRKTPSLVNLAVTQAVVLAGRAFFSWDGRTSSLEQQVLRPFENPLEMDHTSAAMVARVSAVRGYRPYFAEVFGTDAITAPRIGEALADYVRTRLSGNAPWDRFNAGDTQALSAAARRGDAVFFDKGRCGSCHLGGNFTNGGFHNLGVGWDPKTKQFKDEGRFLVTKDERHRGAFKTPGLRDVARRAPYMHDGSLATLRDVVNFYNKGGVANPLQAVTVKPLGLTDDEVAALVAFLESLSGEGYLDRPPLTFPR